MRDNVRWMGVTAGIFMSLALAGCQTPAPQAQPQRQTQPPASGAKVTSKLFVNMVGNAAPQLLCTDNPEFRECLQISEDRCQQEVKQVTPGCSNELLKKMPTHLASRDDGERYGKMLGECVAGKIIFSGRYDYNQLKNCKGFKK